MPLTNLIDDLFDDLSRPGMPWQVGSIVASILFGWLSAFAMVAALVADLFILRPTAMFLINLSQRIRGTAQRPKPAE